MKFQIEGLDPAITSAHVQIHPARRRGGSHARPDVSAYVYLRTEGGRELGHRVVEGDPAVPPGDVPDLKPEAITVVDQTGHGLPRRRQPLLKEQMQAHAREEDWRDKIAEELRHIPGVGVSVLLEAVAGPRPRPRAPAAAAGRAGPAQRPA